jgi:2-dehydro-3-deoxygluconokinase
MNEVELITFGEAMALFIAGETGDLAQVEGFTRRMAGAETNFSVGMTRLGHRTGWVSRLGDDAFGRYIRSVLAEEGVDTSHVTSCPGQSTGFMLKSKAAEGEDPKVEYFRRGSAASHLGLDDFDEAYFGSVRHLHCTGISAALSESTRQFSEHAMRFMRKAGKSISFDPNLRPSLWPSQQAMIEGINALAALADWVLPGISEGRLLTGRETPEDVAAFYLERGASLVVIKLGAEGAYFRNQTADGYVAGVPVEHVVDTVGAGDGFAAGLVSALLEGLDIRSAVARGAQVGAFAIQVVGDMDGLPTREQLLKAMGQTA